MKRLLLTGLLALSACGTAPWDKPGAAQADKDKDTHECMREAYTAAAGRDPSQQLYDACMTARGYKRK